MPQTITSDTLDYQAATDAEAEVLVQAFEAAKEAYDAEIARLGERPPYNRDDRAALDAYHEALEPFQRVLAEANRLLSSSRNLPVGTAVQFSTSSGWNDTDTSHGVIVRKTDASYIVRKEYGGEARLPRENAHEYKSSYSGGTGRSMSVVRTPRQQAAYAEQQRLARIDSEARRAAEQARYQAESARREALGKQQTLLREARERALGIILRRHAEEFAILEKDALDILAEGDDIPGREQTAPLAPETT